MHLPCFGSPFNVIAHSTARRLINGIPMSLLTELVDACTESHTLYTVTEVPRDGSKVPDLDCKMTLSISKCCTTWSCDANGIHACNKLRTQL